MIEKTDIGDLKGIGEKTKKLFESWRRIRFKQLPVRSMDVYRYPEAAGCR